MRHWFLRLFWSRCCPGAKSGVFCAGFYLEALLYSRSSFSDFASKYGRDERFKGIEKSRERESLFQAFLSDLRRREKEKSSLKDKVCLALERSHD